MGLIDRYISGVIVASFLVQIPFAKKWKVPEEKLNNNGKGSLKYQDSQKMLNTVYLEQAVLQDSRTFYGSRLFGKQVLFHKITDHADFEYQKFAFAGNIVNVYRDQQNNIKFDVQLFMSNYNLCVSEIQKITRKEISNDLILKGFVRSELQLA